MSVVIGIDPSFSRTACIAGDRESYAQRCFDGGKGSLYARLDDRIGRAYSLAEEAADWCASKQPQRIVIEGYAYAATQQRSHHDIVELGAILRLSLLTKCNRAQFTEVWPHILKGWASGKGNAKKDFCADAIFERYGKRFENLDLMDAYCLWRIGCQLSGIDAPRCAHEVQAVERILNPGVNQRLKKNRVAAEANARQKKLEFKP